MCDANRYQSQVVEVNIIKAYSSKKNKLPFTDRGCMVYITLEYSRTHVHYMYCTGIFLSKLRFQKWITSHRNLNSNEQKLEYKRTVPVENTIIIREKSLCYIVLNFLCDFRYFTSVLTTFFGAF